MENVTAFFFSFFFCTARLVKSPPGLRGALAVSSEGSVGITIRFSLYAKEIHLHINDSNLSSMKNVQRFSENPTHIFILVRSSCKHSLLRHLIASTTVQGTRFVTYFRFGQWWSNKFPVYFLFQCGKINQHQHASAATVRKGTKCNARDTF